MKSKPKFSIITVSYNSVVTIEQTILSVLNQTYSNIEYIIIDGGSTDGTVEIIRKHEDVISSWVSEPDKGIYDAMNKGIKLATGDWVGIINSDDYYEVDAISKIHEAIIGNAGTELVYGNLKFIKENGVTSIYRPICDLDSICNNMTISHPTVFIKRSVYEKFGLFDLDYKLTADWELLLRFFKYNVSFFYLNVLIANFRVGGAGSGFKGIHLNERFRIRHLYSNKKAMYYDFKDLLIFIYFKIFPQKSMF